MTATPFPIRFETLRVLNAGSVSDRIPVVCLQESADSPDVIRGYRHADFMSVYVARQGSGTHLVEGVPFEVQAGDVYAMGLGMSHRFADPKDLVLDTIHFLPALFPPETQATLAATEGLAPLFLGGDGAESSRWFRLNPSAHLQAVEMLRDMRQEWEADAPDRALMVQATFMRFLVFLARSYRNLHQASSSVGARARGQIELRYAEPLKIGDLATSAFLSIGRFTEVFGAEVGCSPREYLGQVRIRAAKGLLLDTDLPVASVAARTGFADPAYFTRFFRQHVGLSPSEFRGDSALSSRGR